MEKNLAYCGLTCEKCPIYLATREKDDEKRRKMRANIARKIKEHYGEEYEPEDVTDCDGCRTEGGRLFSGSRNCRVRTCARRKGLENCAHCDDYICEKLEEFLAKEPDARARLDAIRREL
jgi:hypothetical protein